MSLTPKQEAFCLAYIETGNASEAYRRAYNAEKMKPATISVKASELLKNGKVAVRVAELQKGHQERHGVTVDSLTDELEDARALATTNKQPAAAVSASMGKAKLHGLLSDRHEHSGPGGGPIRTEDVSGLSDIDRAHRVLSLIERARERGNRPAADGGDAEVDAADGAADRGIRMPS